MSGNKRQMGRGRSALYGLILILAGLLVIEFAARLIEPMMRRAAVEFRADEAPARYRLWQYTLFSSFGGIHQPDAALLWKFRSHLRQPLFTTNSRGILSPSEIEPDKPPNTVRILLLGDSSPVGLGLQRREEAFGELTAQLLRNKWRGLKKVELINAAVNGYTSEQGKRFLRQDGLAYRPDFVVCYFGNNDASINGYLTDRQLFAARRWAQKARSFLYRFATYRLMRNLISPVLPAGVNADDRLPTVRVTPEEFGENIRQIAEMARGIGAQTIVINPPVPYRWPAGLQFKLFSRMTDSAGSWVVADPVQERLERPVAYCFDPTTINKLYGRVDPYVREVFASAYADQGAADSIESAYQAKLKDNPSDPISLNNLGVLRWRNGRFNEALECFVRTLDLDSSFNVARYNLGIALADVGDSAGSRRILSETVDRDYYSLRIKTPYRQALFAAAEGGRATVLDVSRIFREHDNERLFIDHCHPTPAGHRLIAQRLADVIDSLLKQ